jgi:hypothetical protein
MASRWKNVIFVILTNNSAGQNIFSKDIDIHDYTVNVMGLFPYRERCRRSHGHRTHTRPTIHDVTLDFLCLTSIES